MRADAERSRAQADGDPLGRQRADQALELFTLGAQADEVVDPLVGGRGLVPPWPAISGDGTSW